MIAIKAKRVCDECGATGHLEQPDDEVHCHCEGYGHCDCPCHDRES